MRNKVFPHWQNALSILFLLSQSLYLPSAPSSDWCAILIAGAFTILLWLLWHKILGNFNFFTLPGLGGICCCSVIALVSVWLACSEIARLSLFFSQTAFPTLSRFAVICFLLLTAVLLARNGRISLAMWAFPTVILLLIPLLLSMALTLPDWRISEVFPVQMNTAFWHAVWTCFLTTYLPILLLWILFAEEQVHSFSVGIGIGTILLSLTCARNFMLLGSALIQKIAYPTYAAAGLVAIGDFFQRAESLIAGCLTLCAITRLTVFLLTAARALRPLWRALQNKKHLSAADR